MKLKISVSMAYPDIPATPDRPYPTRNECDLYEQSMEIDSEDESKLRLGAIILAFNDFKSL